MAAELEIGDVRVEFVADYVLKALRVKPDRWTKMYALDENKQMCLDFFEKGEQSNLIISTNSAGGLTLSNEWPTSLKSKAIYFVKKSKEPVPKDMPAKNALLYGDISYSPIDQLSAFVDEVRAAEKTLVNLKSYYLI